MILVVRILVESNDGSVLSAAINAAVMACVDGGVLMKFLPNSITIALSNRLISVASLQNFGSNSNNSSSINNSNSNNNSNKKALCFLDPDKEEESSAQAVMVFTINPSTIPHETETDCEKSRLVVTDCKGIFTKVEFNSALNCALSASDKLRSIMREKIKDKHCE